MADSTTPPATPPPAGGPAGGPTATALDPKKVVRSKAYL
jgi:hypothetical protein